MLSDMHFCYFTKEYDARGNCTKFSHFDDKDKPAMTSRNYGGMTAVEFTGKHYDMGNKLKVAEAQVELALQHPEDVYKRQPLTIMEALFMPASSPS